MRGLVSFDLRGDQRRRRDLHAQAITNTMAPWIRQRPGKPARSRRLDHRGNRPDGDRRACTKAAAVMPAARPRRPGNHFRALPTQVPYTQPVPIPPIAAAKYNMGNVLAPELMTTQSQPGRSADDDIAGSKAIDQVSLDRMSQVSTRTNSVKAT